MKAVFSITIALLLSSCSFSQDQQNRESAAQQRKNQQNENILREAEAKANIQAEEDLKKLGAILTDETNSLSDRIQAGERILKNHPRNPHIPKVQAYLFNLRLLGDWTYRKSIDELTKRETFHASLVSENTINLDFPYQGEQPAAILISNRGEKQPTVLFFLQRGQLICSSYDCSFDVAFDDNAPLTLEGTEPASRSSEAMFLPDEILTSIQQSKEMRIRVTIHREGSHTFIFKTNGLQLSKLNLN